MAARARERARARLTPEVFDPVAWRKSNVVFAADGTILYPSADHMPCPSCGAEIESGPPRMNHPFQRHDEASEEEGDEICTCGFHESYHRPHDCRLDNYPPMPCACAGGQPWSCCVNRYARQEQFLLQRLANMMNARAQG